MATSKGNSAPLTFDLKESLLKTIEGYQRKNGIRSKSEVIRLALDNFDFQSYHPAPEEHTQISVRLPLGQKKELTKLARQKKVSIGELLRAALESLPQTPVRGKGDNNHNPGSTVTDKKAAKAKKPAAKAVKKTTARKAAPKAVKPKGKASAASKAAGSPVAKAKKPAAKKPAVKKAAAKKPAVKKAAVKKTAVKKAPAKKPAAKKPAKKK